MKHWNHVTQYHLPIAQGLWYTKWKFYLKIGGKDDSKQALVTTTDTVVKEGSTTMVDNEGKPKQYVVEEAITPPISEKKIDTVNKTDKSQSSNITVDTPKSNKTATFKSLDKSRSTQRTDT